MGQTSPALPPIGVSKRDYSVACFCLQNHANPFPFTGLIDEVKIHHGPLFEDEVAEHAKPPSATIVAMSDKTQSDDVSLAEMVLHCPFDNETCEDVSGYKHEGRARGAQPVQGVFGKAIQQAFAGQIEAMAGGRGGMLWALSLSDGEKLAEYKLDAPPVFDGMIAAGKRLYVSDTSGRVLCLAGRVRGNEAPDPERVGQTAETR